MAGWSSVVLDAVSAPWNHVVSAFLGHLVLWIVWMPSLYSAMDCLDCRFASRLLGIFVSRLRIRPLKPLACVVLSGCAGSDGQTVSLFPAGLRLSLAFSKAVSLVQISCLRLKKKRTTTTNYWMPLLVEASMSAKLTVSHAVEQEKGSHGIVFSFEGIFGNRV